MYMRVTDKEKGKKKRSGGTSSSRSQSTRSGGGPASPSLFQGTTTTRQRQGQFLRLIEEQGREAAAGERVAATEEQVLAAGEREEQEHCDANVEMERSTHRDDTSTDDEGLEEEGQEGCDDGGDVGAGEQQGGGGENVEGSTQGVRFRFRRSMMALSYKPYELRRTIRPEGTRSWWEDTWSGTGHRTPVNTVLGQFCRFFWPGIVSVGGREVGATKWEYYALKPYGPEMCHQKVVREKFWEQFKLPPGMNNEDPNVLSVLNEAAAKVVRNSMNDARKKAIVVYYKRQGRMMNKRQASGIHLTAEQYLQSEVDWMCAKPAGWMWMCHYWASDDFKRISNRHRTNRNSRSGKHKYGADGQVGKAQRMAASSGVDPSVIDVFLEGHQGSDDEHPEQLCDDYATERLGRYIGKLKEKHGPDVDWRNHPFDADAAYASGGGLRHGRLGIGDGFVAKSQFTSRSSASSVGTGTSRGPSRSELLDRLSQYEARQEQLLAQVNFLLSQQAQAYGGSPFVPPGSQFGPFPPVVPQTTPHVPSQGSGTDVQMTTPGLVVGQGMQRGVSPVGSQGMPCGGSPAGSPWMSWGASPAGSQGTPWRAPGGSIPPPHPAYGCWPPPNMPWGPPAWSTQPTPIVGSGTASRQATPDNVVDRVLNQSGGDENDAQMRASGGDENDAQNVR